LGGIGGIGWPEIIVVIAIILILYAGWVLPFRPLFSRRMPKTEAWFVRRQEKLLFRDTPHKDVMPSPRLVGYHRYVPLPIGQTIFLFGSPVLALVMIFADLDVKVVIALITLGPWVLLLPGVFGHFRIKQNRRRKYEYFFMSFAALNCGWWVPLIDTFPVLALRLSIILPIAFLIGGAGLSWWLGYGRSSDTLRPPSLLMRRIYFMAIRPFVLGVFMLGIQLPLSLPFTPGYLLLRFLLVNRFSHTPIVYLRSFHNPEVKSAFGGLVAVVASKFGVLQALVHASQPASDLHALTHMAQRAQMTRVPDEDWQEWVEDRLRCCSAVIIDYTVGTESVGWEIQRAQDLVPSSRIAILVQQGTAFEKPQGIFTLEYDLRGAGKKQARKTLKLWLKKVHFDLPPRAVQAV